MQIAEERLPATGTPAFFMLGNDDDERMLDEAGSSDALRFRRADICELPGGFPMVSFGYSTPTPWNTPRELDEEGMAKGIEEATTSWMIRLARSTTSTARPATPRSTRRRSWTTS